MNNNPNNQENTNNEKEQDKNQTWMQERKSKNPNKIKDKRDRRKALVEREATNQVEDLLVRTAFSTLL